MTALLPWGTLVGAWAIGTLLVCPALRRVRAHDALTRHVVGSLAGIAVVTPLLVFAAALDAFDVDVLGGAGWLVAAVLAPRLLRLPREPWSAPAALALVAATAFALAAAQGRDETQAAGRDQQLYVLFGKALAQTGSAKLTFEGLDAADKSLLDDRDLFHFPGTLVRRNGIDEPIESYFPLAWSAWLAVAHGIGGLEAAYATNAAVVALAGLVLFVLARALYHSAIALGAAVAFYLLPSSIYIAGITLSEPLAGALLLLLPVLAMAGARRAAIPAAVVLLSAALVRIDALIALPIVALSFALATRPHALRSRRLALGGVAAALAATLAAYTLLHPVYLGDNADRVALLALAAMVIVVTGMVASPRLLTSARTVVDSPAVRLGLCVLVALLFLYAATARPLLEPYSVIANGSGLAGSRDWRESSVSNLVAYVSWPVMLAAVAGLCGALLNGWLSRRGVARALLLMLALGSGLLYLWHPHVSPDHPWAIRRFVPLVIPGALLFAALCVRALAGHSRPTRAVLAGAMLAAPAGWTLAHLDPAVVFARENDGIGKTIAQIAASMPPELVVDASGHPALSTALFVGWGARVVPLHDGLARDEAARALERWARTKLELGHSAWLLHDDFLPRTGAVLTTAATWEFERRVVEPTPKAPATRVVAEREKLALSRLVALDPLVAARTFGGEPVWGADEEGFYRTEITPFGMFRYTNGEGSIVVPAEGLRDAVALKIDLFSFARPDRMREVTVLIDGERAWSGSVAPALSTLRVPVVPPSAPTVTITIRSEIVPAAEGGSSDPRTLGVGLLGIRALRENEAKAPAEGVAGFRSALARVGPSVPIATQPGGTANVVLDVTNAGSVPWAALQDVGTPVGATRLAIRWHPRGVVDRFVADNRADFGVALLPGDRTRMLVGLTASGLDGKPLPPGDYDVRIGLVREGMALFADNGDVMLTIPASVEAP